MAAEPNTRPIDPDDFLTKDDLQALEEAKRDDELGLLTELK